MDAHISRLEDRLSAVEQQLRHGDERFARLELAQERNTEVTVATGTAVSNLSKRVSEPLAYFDKAMMGLKVLGAIGVAGMWAVRRWYVIVGLFIAFKIVASGGSITDAWNAGIGALQLAPPHH